MTDVIVALDYDASGPALALVDALGPHGDFYKVGVELFGRAGPRVLDELVGRGKRVFLDLKLHDIPATVAGAVRAAADTGAEMVTVHATGGSAMLGAAVEAAAGRTRILAVTVLTSLGPSELGRVLGRREADPTEEVLRLAQLSAQAGVWGVVCSPREAARVRGALGPDFGIVTPGIRPAGEDAHDQARVMTPAQAVRAGSNALVVGRSVTRSADPVRALDRIRAEVRSAVAEAVT